VVAVEHRGKSILERRCLAGGYVSHEPAETDCGFFARHRDCRLFSAPVEIDIVRAAGSDDVPSEDSRASMRVMRAVSIIAVLLLLAVNALALLPAANAFQPYLLGGALALGLIVLATILAGRGSKRATAEAVRPVPVPMRASDADAEIVNLLATLQARGRLVDFLMDDINAHDDAQAERRAAFERWSHYVALLIDRDLYAAHRKFVGGTCDENRDKEREEISKTALAAGGDRWSRYLKITAGGPANVTALRQAG